LPRLGVLGIDGPLDAGHQLRGVLNFIHFEGRWVVAQKQVGLAAGLL
jgi:hypothetical protein